MAATPPPDPRSVTLTTGFGTFTVGGLGAEEHATVVRDWSRCEPREPAQGTAPELRYDGDGWRQFHESLVYRTTSRAIDSARGTHLMFHGACLADQETGAAIVLAAASGTGKTTATRVLGRHFSYLTDETAIVDVDDLHVTPYAKPLSLLDDDGRRPKRQAGPDALGLAPTRDARVRRIAVLDRVREPEAPVTARAEPMDLADALQELVPQTSSLSSLPRGLVALCRVLDEVGGAQRLVYGEADDLRAVVDALLAEEPIPQSRSWDPLEDDELAASVAPDAAPAAGEALVRRAADDGVVTAEGTLVLLVDTRLLVLDGIGPLLWLLLAEPRTVPGLLEELGRHGPLPDDAEAQVRKALDALKEHGLVRFRDDA